MVAPASKLHCTYGSIGTDGRTIWKGSMSHGHLIVTMNLNWTQAIPCMASSTDTWVSQPPVCYHTTRMYPSEVQLHGHIISELAT